MPYTKTTWTNGSTALSQTNMNNLEKQFDEASLSEGPDQMTAFVLTGLTVTKTAAAQITVAAGTAYPLQTDGSLRQRKTTLTTEATVTINTTYYLDLNPDGTFSWATSHSGTANYLSIASVTTDGSGNVLVIMDARQLFTNLFPSLAGSVQLPKQTVLLGGPIAAPVVTGMAAAATSGGNLTNGAYKYVVTYAFDGGETLQSAAVTMTSAGANKTGSLTGIPVSADPRITRRKIYRTQVGGSTYSWVATLGDNTTTTYTDAAADTTINIASVVATKVPPTHGTAGGTLRTGYPWSGVASNTTNQGTVTGTTFGQTTLATGDGTTGALFNGTSDKVTFPVTGLPVGNSAWSLLALVKPTNATNSIDAAVLSIGNGGRPGQVATIAQAAGGGWYAATGHYRDVALADVPVRLYPMNEPSGTTITDASTSAVNGTLQGSGTTLGVTGLVVGDPDTAYTFNGSGGVLATGTTGLPLVNAAWTLEVVFKYVSAPGGVSILATHGGTGANNGAYIGIDAAGKLNGAIFGGGTTIVSGSAIGVGNHHAALTWDGTTLTLWLDGVSVGTPATPAALNITNAGFAVGQSTGGTSRFTGTCHYAGLYATNIGSAAVNAHYTAFSASMRTTAAGTSVAGTKHLLSASYDGTTLTAYLDGVSLNTLTPSARNLTLTSGRIGDLASSIEGAYFPGTIQKAAVFNYALTAQQMAWYNTLMAGASGNVTFDQQVTDDGAVRYFTLNDAVSATVAAETSRYEAVFSSDGQLKTRVPVSFDGGIGSVGGVSTSGAIGVPLVAARFLATAVTSTAAVPFTLATSGNTGLYRISVSFYVGAATSTITVQLQYASANHPGTTSTAYFMTGSTLLNAASLAVGEYPTACLSAYVQGGGTFVVNYTNATGTPSDVVTVVAERVA